MADPETGSEGRRPRRGGALDCCARPGAQSEGFRRSRSHPGRAGRPGRGTQRFQGRHDMGSGAMNRTSAMRARRTPKPCSQAGRGGSVVKQRLYLFDTTLRDGAQTNGVDFTLADKVAIARMLDEFGIDYIEGGYPGANPTDTQLFSEPRKFAASFTAFGMTRRPRRSLSNDPGVAALLEAEADAICFVAKAWDYHVRVALETTPEENLASIRDSVRAAKAKGREVLVDCEHLFDGYKSNPQFALACARAAYDEGARWVVLCDTNGGTLPHEVEAIVRAVVKVIPGDHVGIHAHNDTEQAVANSLAAVRAGARQIQGTLNGLGERCGNANLCSL